MSLEMYSINQNNTGLGEDDRIFAIGDIHGEIDDLDRILDNIFRHMNKVQMNDHVIFLGDYIDRGKHSFEVISRLMDLDESGLKTTFLLGNHEAFLVNFLEAPSYECLRDWAYCGGFATVQSYLENAHIAEIYAHDPQYYTEVFNIAFPDNHLDFLKKMPLIHQVGKIKFVHAGLRPDREMNHQTSDDMLWIREPFLSSDYDFEGFVVHGHSPSKRPQLRKNRIGLDTGSALGGFLSAAAITANRIEFLSSER